jgi:hypothetical protein
MIKCNGKDVIPRLNGKELSRVMYNGKQIYPTYKYEDIEFINVNNIQFNGSAVKLNHPTLPENCVITKARIQVSISAKSASRESFYISLYKSLDDLNNDSTWRRGSWFTLFSSSSTGGHFFNYTGSDPYSSSIMFVDLGTNSYIGSDETNGHDIKCSYDFELIRDLESTRYFGTINKIQEVDFEDLTTGKKYTNGKGNSFGMFPIFNIDNTADIYAINETSPQTIETLKIILTARTIV